MFKIGCKTIYANHLNLAKTYLKVIKGRCFRLMSPLCHLKPYMYRAWPSGHDGSVLLSVGAQALLCIYLVCR
jgi:hypothetical protein